VSPHGYLMVLQFEGAGRIVSWDVFAGRAGTQRLQVWRVGNGDGTGCEGACSVSAAATGQKTWTLVCENVATSPTAGKNHACHFQFSYHMYCTFRC
jgi:hypothetical protein